MPTELITASLFRVPPPKNETGWHVIHDGKEIGPLTQDALVEMAETGRIEQDDLVREVGGEWTKASEVAILRRQFSLPEPNVAQREPVVVLLANLGRYQTPLAIGFVAIVIVIGVGIGFHRSMSPSLSVAGTTWQGSENLERFGHLKFDFRSDGKVIMTDAARRVVGDVHGKWSQSGANVTMQFSNCRYQGTIEKSVLKGTATFHQNGKQWTFSVSKT